MSTSPGANDGVDVMRELLRDGGDDSLAALVRSTTATANTTIAGSDHAGLTVRIGDRYLTRAATGDLVTTVDELQYRHGGPSLDALTDAPGVVHVGDLSDEDRWPHFTSAVLARTAVRSMLSFGMRLGRTEPVGSLTVYALVPHAFDVESIEVGRRLADYCAAVLAHARELDRASGLQRAVTSNRDIGTAVGILMTQHRITRERAFDLLRDSSQHDNRTVRDVAEHVLLTGTLPGRSSAWHAQRSAAT